MANFFRVIRLALWFFFGVALVGVPMFAYASETEIPATVAPEAHGQRYYTGAFATTSATTMQASCKMRVDTLFASMPNRCAVVSGSNCYVGYSSCVQDAFVSSITLSDYCPSAGINSATVSSSYVCPSVASCPANQNWTLSGTVCTRPACVSPQVRDASTGVCEAPACPAAGTANGFGGAGYTGTGSMPATLCISGCSYETGGVAVVLSNSWATGAGKSLGTTCTGNSGTSMPADDPRTKCVQAGQGFGTVNGAVVCVPANTVTEKTTSTATTVNKDASNNTTSTANTSNDSTKTTSCTDGNCTTTTTTTVTNPDGTKTATTATDTQPKATLCEENPALSICKDSSFAGACAAGAQPACTGDAVQCAQAAAAWKIQCNMETEPTDAAYSLGKTISSGGADPLGNPLSAANTTSLDIASIVSTAGGQRSLTASCIASPSFTVMGKSFTFDTTNFCRFAQIVGYLMVAASSVIAIRMVASGNT